VSEWTADLWRRATRALRVAEHDLSISPDAAASRAYYAAFYAVSARFALHGVFFNEHSAVGAAVHRDLVRPGIWPNDLGAGFTRLSQLRARGDYGGKRHVSTADAQEAIEIAARILRAVSQAGPQAFPLADDL